MLARLLLLILVVVPILRADDASNSGTWPLPSYETYGQLLPLPPTPGSPAERVDLGAVEGLQSTASKAEIEHAHKTAVLREDFVFVFFGGLRENFTLVAYPQATVFFNKLRRTGLGAINYLRDHYHRLRPYQAFPQDVKQLTTAIPGGSYPGGHATHAWLSARVMGELDPVHKADYLGRAYQVGMDRLVSGMHYPSDISAAQLLGEQIFADLMKDPGFRSDLEKLRKAEFSGK